MYLFIYLQIQQLITQLPGNHKDKKEKANWSKQKKSSEAVNLAGIC